MAEGCFLDFCSSAEAYLRTSHLESMVGVPKCCGASQTTVFNSSLYKLYRCMNCDLCEILLAYRFWSATVYYIMRKVGLFPICSNYGYGSAKGIRGYKLNIEAILCYIAITMEEG